MTEPAPDRSSQPIRILLVDDHGMVRRGLRGYLELLDDIEIVGEAENGRLALEAARELHPDVVLMDLLMPESNILGKLGLASRTQAALYAVEHGLVPPA